MHGFDQGHTQHLVQLSMLNKKIVFIVFNLAVRDQWVLKYLHEQIRLVACIWKLYQSN